MEAASHSIKESNWQVLIYDDLSSIKKNEEESSPQYKTQPSVNASGNHLEIPVASAERPRNREAEAATNRHIQVYSSIRSVLPGGID